MRTFCTTCQQPTDGMDRCACKIVPKPRCVCNWAVEDEDGNMICELPVEGGLIFISEQETEKETSE